ncbi:MFS transporter [Nonomuraea basaltis]|uniref:MFS transporter n=1 Tax=Nonomuraea basaltis TaxID=2495887 RepID=UPI00110C5A82|nr:MFS transporter [Nonomuraea basaltis]TMS00652.1 MFS transporter [Nonomuraea basaltis]
MRNNIDSQGKGTAGSRDSADRVGSYARKAIVASVAGYAMDGFDLLILSFALGAIASDMGVGLPEVGTLTSVTLWGAVIGGLVFGILADRFGRVRMLTLSILLFAVFTGLCALAPNVEILAVFRFLAGLGLGGEFGIGMTLAAEAWPAGKRARATALVGLGWQSGVLLAALLSPLIISALGWRGLFAIGAIPAVLAFVLRNRMREPELFLRTRQAAKTERMPFRLLVSDPVTLRATIGILVLCSVQNFGYYGVMTWLPTHLSTTFGFSLVKSGLWTAVTVVGMACGIYVFGLLADRIGRRPAFWLYQSGAIVSLLIYSRLSDATLLLVGGAVMGFFVNGMLGGLGALMAESYTTAVRTTAQNVLFNLGRGVGGFAPLVIALIAGSHGFPVAIALLAGIYLLEIVAMFLIPERRGADLT